MPLKRGISRVGLMCAAIGGIVGSGWLLGPLYAAQYAGPAAILAWAFGGILMMFIALTFAELASTFPVAGGMARFAHYSHGTITSFTLAWVGWLASLMVAPIETMAALQYAGNYIPGIIIRHAQGADLTRLGLGAATVVMLLLCCLNFYGVKYLSKSNIGIVLWKLIIPVITIIYLVHAHFDWNNFHGQGGFAPYGFKGILQALPSAGIIFSFIGYSPAIQLAGEAESPQRAIPFAIFGAIGTAIILYVIIEIAFIGALPAGSLSGGWKALSFHDSTGPIAGLLASLGVVWFLKVIYVDAAVSPLGTAYIYTAATARMNVAMVANGYMPRWFAKLNHNAVPARSILLNFALGLLFFLPFPGWQEMVSFLVSCFVLAYAVGPISCITLRYIAPERERKFHLPYAKTICCIAFYICNLLIFWTGWSVIYKMLLIVAVGYFYLFIRWGLSKNKIQLHIRQSVWLAPYLLGLAVLSYLGTFGKGTGYLPFGWDFLVIALFSVIIFVYAVHLAIKTPTGTYKPTKGEKQ